MTTPYLLADIKSDEGCRLAAYPDPISHGAPWTIGYGHTGPEVHPGLDWTPSQCDGALATDAGKVQLGLDTAMPWWRTLNDPRQDVLVNMAFNLGLHGLLAFSDTLALIKGGQFQRAGLAMLDSTWAKQLPNRSHRLAMQMETGVRQTPQ